jgi:D-serine deaminase-like pyridoxal phosphate-dependent protein
MSTKKDWYTIDNIDEVDSPSLVVYPERVKKNIETLVNSINDINRLRPHIKTHKSSEVIGFMLEAGITKFKCATIAEGEVLGAAGAPDVLLAYQPVGPKAERLASLMAQFPNTTFASLIDNLETAKQLSQVFSKHGLTLRLFIDLNVGMNRTGIEPRSAVSLFEQCQNLPGIDIVGLHGYDGHLRDTELDIRKKKCDESFKLVSDLQQVIKNKFNKELIVVAGGTPTYSIHKNRPLVECSPGTFIYWDKGYSDVLKEQQYVFAALVITRVVSKPSDNIICVDLGHKAIASENPLTSRVFFLNAPNLIPIGHSEEHLVLKTDGGEPFQIGDVLYGVPFHICPTVALHQGPAVVKDGVVKTYWNTASRSRMITV